MHHKAATPTGRRSGDVAAAAGGRGWLSLLPVLGGAVLAAVLLSYGDSETRFEEFALGKATSTYFARLDDRPIHCRGIEDAGECIDGARRRGLSRAALWLGNSQLHAVNQLRPGQETASPMLFRRLSGRRIDLLTFSQPNASLQEHYVLFEYLRERIPLDMLILAVTFDDLRETGLRSDIVRALEDAATVAALGRSEVGRSLIRNHRDLSATDEDLAGVTQTIQEHSERYLNNWLDSNLRLWSRREQARGRFFTTLYQFRNSALGINPQSKRRLIRGRYAMNMAALDAILSDCREAGTRVLVYVTPLRHDLDLPYVVEEYEEFKRDLQRRSRSGGAEFANLEELVPPELWGAKDSTTIGREAEVDFMHFKSPGHVLLAERLGELIEERFEGLR
jgi:hypothetical protein